jgi:hypothetical protein
VYSPLTGVDFLKRLMTPIPPSSVLFMLQAGYAAQRVMPITLDSINGIANGSYRRQREPDPRFERLVALIGEAQLAGTIKIRIERAKEGAESAVVVFPPSKDLAAFSRRREITKLLGLNADLQELKIYYGAATGKPDQIDMDTRSMLEIMLEFAAAVRVPETDVAEGNATPGMVSTQSPTRWGGPPIRILVGDAAPNDAFVAVPYDNRWYWIAKTDIETKSTFGVLMLLFSVAETGTKGPSPVVTIPANQ